MAHSVFLDAIWSTRMSPGGCAACELADVTALLHLSVASDFLSMLIFLWANLLCSTDCARRRSHLPVPMFASSTGSFGPRSVPRALSGGVLAPEGPAQLSFPLGSTIGVHSYYATPARTGSSPALDKHLRVGNGSLWERKANTEAAWFSRNQ
ncbi:hypothetical protein DFH07DRAFT_777220 [Mycena maculata]|uniref:Uncharacterized protein n=1 Tax=Mycena maculata TaxID=230809 RepID=A0AAD7N3J2_9AGAR|nr:hypothetical protein DFH07DRAFT_777220 [Mycena maculata]